MAAVRAHRRAHGPPLHPGHLRRQRDMCAESARRPLVSATGAPELVLRRAADLGEAQGRPGGDAGRPARGAAPPGPGGDRALAAARAPAPARRAGPAGARGQGGRSRRRTCSPSSARCSAWTRSSPSTSAQRRRPVEVLEFFHALGIELAELWGMSETCGTGTVNRPGAVKIGTVGPASPGVELKLAEDGEVLCRGDFLMAGYRNQPEQDGRDDRRRGLAAHRRHRDDRRGRLSEDRRPQEGADHQRRRQEHVAGEHRGGAQVGQPR